MPEEMKLYKDYFWKEGVPYGRGKGTIKILHDPYRKWISIELYENKKFKKLIYDSRLLDFRKLHPSHHTAWNKETIAESQDQVDTLIRDQDDRVVYIEKQFFKNNRCMECHIYSPHGILLSIHKMFYMSNGDAFNGLILFDAHGIPVLEKRYSVDEKTDEFDELIEEKKTIENIY